MEENLLQLSAPVEVLVPILQSDLRSSAKSTEGRGVSVNKFLLCTLVCGMAREIKARAAQNGRSLPLLKIVRDVLHTHLEEESRMNGLSAASDLLKEETLRSEIERQLQEYLRQSHEHPVEERRIDLESVIAAEAAKRTRGVIKRGYR
ncbi:MAG: hypothetical protein L0220_13645 [Acidobacteria bacterium]|nr:hypothetical protein [Acidobacteriota bacterium]